MDFLNLENKDLEIRTAGDRLQVAGYASVFEEKNSYGEVVRYGAFAESLSSGRQVRFLFNHDPAAVIGRILEIQEDEKGLFFVAEFLSEVEQARNVYQMLKNKAIDGVSIGFIATDDDYQNGVRFVKKAELWEISIVTFPACHSARINEVRRFDALTAAAARLTAAVEELKQIDFV